MREKRADNSLLRSLSRLQMVVRELTEALPVPLKEKHVHPMLSKLRELPRQMESDPFKATTAASQVVAHLVAISRHYPRRNEWYLLQIEYEQIEMRLRRKTLSIAAEHSPDDENTSSSPSGGG